MPTDASDDEVATVAALAVVAGADFLLKTHNTSLEDTIVDAVKLSGKELNNIGTLEESFLRNKAAINQQIKRLKLAKSIFQVLNRDSSEIDKNISILENSNKRAKAEEFLSSLLNERPEKLELRIRLADLYARSEKVAKAIEQLDMIVDAQLSAGNKIDAAVSLKTIIALKPPDIAKYQKTLNKVME
jgi:predicted Zn-dependent protease